MIGTRRGLVRAVRQSARVGPYILHSDHVAHPDGSSSAVLRTADLDLEALDAARRASVLAAFVRLCRAVETPVQLLIRTRPAPLEAMDAQRPSVHAALDRAQREHWEEHVVAQQVHARDVYMVARAPQRGALETAAARLDESARAIGVGAVRLCGAQLRDVFPDLLDTSGDVSWRVEAQHARIGDVLVRGFSMRRLPGHPVAAGWLAPLLRMQAECDIAIHLAPASLADALHTLGRRLRDFSAHRLLESERGAVGDVHVDVALDSALRLRGQLARNVGRPLLLSVTATVRGRTLAELNRRCDVVRLGFRSALIDAEPAHFRHLSAYITTLPLAVDALGSSKLVESESAATCFPWTEATCSDSGGYRVGFALASGAPVRLAPFDTERHANANIAVFAASGHGKSFALGALVLEAATHGAGAVIVDPEGEHESVVTALGGSYLPLAPGGGASVNVFDALAGDPEEAVAAVTDLVSVVCGGRLTDVQRAIVDSAARAAQQSAAAAGRTALLEDCVVPLAEQAPDVALVVRRFCSGALGELFNRPTSMRLQSDVCGISLRDMPAEHVPAAALIVARWLWSMVRRERKRRHLFFDEVGALCAHPPLRALLVQLARRCRKYGASLVVATQNLQDLLATDEGSVVATNSAMVLLGGHRPAEAERMERAFGLTPAQRGFLETAARGEFLLLAGDRRLEIRIDVPARHSAILHGQLPDPVPPLDGRRGRSQDMGAPGRADPNMW